MKSHTPSLGLIALIAGCLSLANPSRSLAAKPEPSHEKQPVLISVTRMTMDTALRVAQAALTNCRKQGIQVSVSVLDRNGDEQVMLRDVLASNITMEIARKKAYTSVLFRRPSSAMHNQFPDYSIPKLDSLIIEGGAVPIEAGGKFLGSVGVSGAPSPKTDESCAKAGVDAVADDLEMSTAE